MRTRHLPDWIDHALAWLCAAAIAWTQPWGLTSADTKHDLAANPAGFLRGALHAWTDTFTFGQLQNQAYGYLFPQGAFFLATDALPDWVAQRLWWTLVIGIGLSGMLLVFTALGLRGRRWAPWRALGAAAYVVSPHTLTTLTAISSETWPAMLAPWIVAAMLRPVSTRAQRARVVAAATLPVAAMGAINATATVAACLPAAVVLAWRWARGGQRRALAGVGVGWALGCVAVSLWWMVPLVVLGRYAAPFTQFIESAAVTTRWLNPAEVLRGTTSWAPFVDTERAAGSLLVTHPVFVVATVAVAGLGLAGLAVARSRGCATAGVWVAMLLIGVAVLCCAGGDWAPAGHLVRTFLDGPGAPLRNLHKFDALVRLPVAVGVAYLGLACGAQRGPARGPSPSAEHRTHLPRQRAVCALIAATVALSAAPALHGGLLPRGAYQQVPDYWRQAADFLNSTAAGTRTLILPEASFARQDWGWTRDEPAQPLLEVPWAVRDAVPLVGPETIRGLDGLIAVAHEEPAALPAALRGAGIGAVLVRHDVAEGASTSPLRRGAVEQFARAAGTPIRAFGPDEQVQVILLDPQLGMTLADAPAVTTVRGGGEAVALLHAALGTAAPLRLVAGDAGADIVTDTPMAVMRNYGTLVGAQSAPLAPDDDTSAVRNPITDYPSIAPRTQVITTGPSLSATSCACTPGALGGADPARSLNAIVDADPTTAWWPAPGDSDPHLRIDAPLPTNPRLHLTTTADARLTISDGDQTRINTTTRAGRPTTLTLPGTPTHIDIAVHSRTGIADLAIAGVDMARRITVPETTTDPRAFFFQRLAVPTGTLDRTFSTHRDLTVRLRGPDDAKPASVEINGTAYHPGDTLTLPAGEHHLHTTAAWVLLADPDWAPAGAPPGAPQHVAADHTIATADHERILNTHRAANPGLRATLDGQPLEATSVGAGMQGFAIPAGIGGTLELSFAGDRPLRAGLAGGGALAALVVLACAAVLVATRRADGGRVEPAGLEAPPRGGGTVLLAAGALGAAGGIVGLATLAAAWAIIRLTTIRPGWLIGAAAATTAAWLARAPWPAASYAGDSPLLACAALAMLAALACARPRHQREHGASTSS